MLSIEIDFMVAHLNQSIDHEDDTVRASANTLYHTLEEQHADMSNASAYHLVCLDYLLLPTDL